MAACRSPDGQYECVILEKPPPGFLMQSPYTQRVLIRDRSGQALAGRTLESSTDSCALSDPKVVWNGEGFVASSANRPLGRGFVNKGKQIWPDNVWGDSDLADLADFAPLREVNAYGPEVTDAGLMHLATCPNLTKLRLQYTQVTAGGRRRLQALLPHLSIEDLSATSRPAVDEDAPSGER